VAETSGRAARSARPRMGRRAPSQRGREHAPMARCLSREPSQDHGVLHRPRAGPAALRALPRARRRAVVRNARRAESGARWRTNCAISAWAARSCPRRRRRG
jgi:hypothetical protein